MRKKSINRIWLGVKCGGILGSEIVFSQAYISESSYQPTPPHVKNGRGKLKKWKK